MEFKGGYTGRILEVDLTNRLVSEKPLSSDLVTGYIGGRGFTSRIQYDGITPSVDPLGPENILVFATGPLTGSGVPASSRFVVACRSPLTGILGDANCGGHWGPELKFSGYDMVIARGRAEKPVYLSINDGHAEIRDAAHIWGKDTKETERIIKKDLGDEKVQIAAIGQAGENLVKVASIMANLDHAAARTGVGAAMGSKRLKAIAVRGTKDVKVAEIEDFENAIKDLMQTLNSDDQSSKVLPGYGTTVLVSVHNSLGGMATRNWQTGVFEGAQKIDGDALREQYLLKGRACFNCPGACDRYSVVKDGEFKGIRVGGPEYFTIVSFGSKCGNDNLASILKANELSNLYGLDTASTGGIVGFAMECYEKGLIDKRDTDGLDLSWGNYESILELIRKIAFREGFGALLADGVKQAAKAIGRGAEKYAIHVKGMDCVTIDPRALKVYNLRYAVATRGADHLRISVLGAYGLDSLPLDEAARKLKYWQDIVAVPDAMGFCKFPYIFFSGSPEITVKKALTLATKLYSSATGIHLTESQVIAVSERIATTERAHNARLGIRRRDDTLPRRFLEEPLPEGPKKGSVYDILDPLLDEFYKANGCDTQTGIPTRETLTRLGLEDIAQDLESLKAHG